MLVAKGSTRGRLPTPRAGDQGQRGQVVVEQAIILPMMIFFILGMVQLAMLQHARIAADYAAYNAAKAGTIYNANLDRMETAATISLLPTMARSDSWTAVGENYLKHMAGPKLAEKLLAKVGIHVPNGLRPVWVKILAPCDLSIFGRLGGHLNGKQIDFDDWRPAAAEANVLSVEVHFLYPMRIPFANWFVQLIWLAQRTDVLKKWRSGPAFLNPTTGIGPLKTNVSARDTTLAAAAMEPDLRGVLVYRAFGYYVFPIRTWYTMRMQSNLYEKNVQEGCSR